MDRASTEALAADIAADDTDRDLLWAVVPTLPECTLEPLRHPRGVELPRDLMLRTGLIGPRLVRVGDVAWWINTENQARTLLPVASEYARRRELRPQVIRPTALHPHDLRCAWRRCKRLESALLSRGRELGVALDATGVRRRLLKAMRGGIAFRHVHERHGVQTLVVSNQHLADHRAALRSAHRCGATSVYIPHAPAADTDTYRDLPVSIAALRGPREVTYYADHGARPERLRSIGNPAFPPVRAPQHLDGPLVLGLSPWPRDRLRRVIEFVADGVGPRVPVVVAPHPRSDRRQINKLIRRDWTIHRGRTLSLLQRGPRLLIQHSSGISWEGLYLGIPTTQIALEDGAPSYALIAPPYVPVVRCPQDLGELLQVPPETIDRSRLQGWAREWCVAVGDVAKERAVNVLEDVPDGPVLTWDAWTIR